MENNSSRLLFISKTKLVFSHPLSALSGFLRIEDASNLATIEGEFTNGHCESATIYSQQLYIIRNVEIQIEENREVRIYGDNAEEIQEIGKSANFIGSYRGYRKYGRGVYYLTEDSRNYENEGFWIGEVKEGMYAKTHESGKEEQNTYQYSMFRNGELVDRKRIVKKNGWMIEQGQHSRSIFQLQKESIVREQSQKLKDWIKKCEAQMPHQVAAGFISATKTENLYLSEQISNIKSFEIGSKMCNEICQMYFAYLARSPSHQAQSQTAIISLQTSQIASNVQLGFDQLQEERSRLSLLSSTQLYMSRYSGPYNIFSSSWDRVIFPFVKQYSNCRHFLFASVSLRTTPILCTFYNSLQFKKVQDCVSYYLSLRFFLLTYANRWIPCQQNLINNIKEMKWEVNRSFPQQTDNYSCGVFMLQGISDLMHFGEVRFSSTYLPTIKRQMMKDLQFLACS